MASETQSPAPPVPPVSPLVDFVAGCVGGVVQVLTGHPLDTLKVRLQTQSASAPQFAGMMDCARQTLASEGVAGLYKGMSSPLVGVSLINAVLFLDYGLSQAVLRSPEDGDGPLPMRKVFVSGMLAGAGVALVEGPFDLFKSKMQVQYAGDGSVRYRNVFDVAARLWAARGFAGLYQGLGITLARNLVGNTAYFYFYELFKRALAQPASAPTQSAQPAAHAARPAMLPVLVAGGLAGTMYWLTCFPLDNLKSRMQTDAIQPAARKYPYVSVAVCTRKCE